jgi:Protein of unknown function (DUF2793)
MQNETPNLALPFLFPSQSDKHVYVNSALSRLDCVVQLRVKSQKATAPPISPAHGEAHIIGIGAPTGAWLGASLGTIMVFADGAWSPIAPLLGWLAYVEAEGRFVVWSGLQWVSLRDVTNSENSAKNLLINSALEIWQRGQTHAISAGQTKVTADRWRCQVGSSGAVTVSRVDLASDAGAPLWVRNALRINQTSASPDGTLLEQRVEDVATVQNGPVTLSVWARASVPVTLSPRITQVFGAGGSATLVTTGSPLQVSASWERINITVTLPALGTSVIGPDSYLGVGFVGPASQVYWLEIAVPMAEAGTIVGTLPKPAPGETLQRCHRYFCKTFPIATAPASNTQDIGGPFESAYTSIAYGNLMSWQFPIAMRKAPVMATFNPYATGQSGMAIAGSGNYAVDVYGLTEFGVLLRNTQALGFAPTPVNLHVTADAEL